MHVFESEDVECLLNGGQDDGQWRDVEFEVALDSGSIVNVCHPDDVPGYVLQESPGSRRGQNVVVGDGGKLQKHGTDGAKFGSEDGKRLDKHGIVHFPNCQGHATSHERWPHMRSRTTRGV